MVAVAVTSGVQGEERGHFPASNLGLMRKACYRIQSNVGLVHFIMYWGAGGGGDIMYSTLLIRKTKNCCFLVPKTA